MLLQNWPTDKEWSGLLLRAYVIGQRGHSEEVALNLKFNQRMMLLGKGHKTAKRSIPYPYDVNGNFQFRWLSLSLF